MRQAFRVPVQKLELLRGDLAGLFAQIAVHHCPTARAQVRLVLDHAGGNFRNVGDLRAAQAEGVAGAHLLRLGAEGKACARRQGGERDSEGQYQTGLANSVGEGSGHFRHLG